VGRGVRFCAPEPILLIHEEHEAHRTPWTLRQAGQQTGRLNHQSDSGTIVLSSYRQVPAVEVRAKEDDLVRALATAQVGDDVC
jgi:hypothetical protein